MFTALYQGNRINIMDYESPQTELSRNELFCNVCQEPLFVRHGLIKRQHFAHYSDSACTFERLQGEPESEEHSELKEQLARWYHKLHPDAKVQMEQRICDGKRIADIFIEYPTGHQEAIECQLAKITSREVLERTQDYESAGIPVVWFFRSMIITPAFEDAVGDKLRTFYSVTVNTRKSTS